MTFQYPLDNKTNNSDCKLYIDISKFSIEELFWFLFATLIVSPEKLRKYLRQLSRETLEQLSEFIERFRATHENNNNKQELTCLINIIQVSITSIYADQKK